MRSTKPPGTRLTHGASCDKIGYTCSINGGNADIEDQYALDRHSRQLRHRHAHHAERRNHHLQSAEHLLYKHDQVAAFHESRQQSGQSNHDLCEIPVPVGPVVLLAGFGNTSVRRHLAAGKFHQCNRLLRAWKMRSENGKTRGQTIIMFTLGSTVMFGIAGAGSGYRVGILPEGGGADSGRFGGEPRRRRPLICLPAADPSIAP